MVDYLLPGLSGVVVGFVDNNGVKELARKRADIESCRSSKLVRVRDNEMIPSKQPLPTYCFIVIIIIIIITIINIITIFMCVGVSVLAAR